MTRITSVGKCRWCGVVLSKPAVGRHLTACAKSRSAANLLTPASASHAPLARKRTARRWMHIAFEGSFNRSYWLHLGVPAVDSLWELDTVLRNIWLDCCGHMSAFKIDGEYFTESPWGEADGPDMSLEVGKALRVGDRFEYEYDFGSTTRLAGRVLADLPDVFPKGGVQVLARNDPPEHRCVVCGQPAARLCIECTCRGPATFCNTCVKAHDCDEGYLLPVVNSPRMGVCAYCGPSKEP